jgi:hypothetical protein
MMPAQNNEGQSHSKSTFLRNVILKALVLFIALNIMWAWAGGGSAPIGKISLYNRVFPGRLRLPFGEDASRSYNLSLSSFDAMLASHILTGSPKQPNEYRVILIGDSSIWGTLLKPEETLAGVLDGKSLRCGEKTIRFYNLGFPTLALAKDYLMLQYALEQQPDALIWSVTLEAFPRQNQLTSPQVAGNRKLAERAFREAGLDYQFESYPTLLASIYENSLVGGRRDVVDVIRLQLYGVLWAATRIDQYYPEKFPAALVDFNDDVKYQGWQPRTLTSDDLAFDILTAGIQRAGNIPVLLINEPMLISQGRNSHLRYNFYYPRWAYDQYREMLASQVKTNGWQYIDMWDAIPPQEFTNSAIHLSPAGVRQYAQLLETNLLQQVCK